MLLQNLRARIGARINGDREAGFTLIELLVVMLILGILAAIALPAFFNQKSKATDAKAKESAHSAQVAMETCATDSTTGGYTNCAIGALAAIEPTLPPAPSGTAEGLEVSNLGATTYTITVTAANTLNKFQIIRNGGSTTFPCQVPATSTNRGGCPGVAVAPGSWN